MCPDFDFFLSVLTDDYTLKKGSVYVVEPVILSDDCERHVTIFLM